MVTKVKTECPYADKCIDEGGSKCVTCMHNEKRSYYRHYDPYPYQPYREPWHYEPWVVTWGDYATAGTPSYYLNT